MPTPTTPDLILEAARLLFNEHGYAATTQSSIAAEVGIAQGNLTYHFPAKRDLVVALRDEASALVGERAATHQPSDVCTDYAAHVAFMMDLVWRYRFLLRDRAQLVEAGLEPGASPQMVADLARLTGLVRRFDEEGLVRRGAGVDLDSLARSLWIVARYWLDHVDEFEHIDSAHWEHFERGLAQHRAVLAPCLTAQGRRRLDEAFAQIPEQRRGSQPRRPVLPESRRD